MAVDLKTLDYCFQGEPFCDISAKSALDLPTMNWAFKATPFVSNVAYVAPTTHYVSKAADVAIASVAKFADVAVASIASILGKPVE